MWRYSEDMLSTILPIFLTFLIFFSSSSFVSAQQPSQPPSAQYLLQTQFSFDDFISPISSLFLHRTTAPKTEIVEIVQNGDFSDGFRNWKRSGDVQQCDSFVCIGKNGGMVQENTLTQTLPETPPSICIEYVGITSDLNVGFDNPTFELFANNRLIYYTSNATFSPTDIDETKMTCVQFHPSQEPLTLSLRAGNSGDDQYPSWIKIKRITSSLLFESTDSKISASTPEKTGAKLFINDLEQAFENLLPIPIGSSILKYFARDSAGNSEQEKTQEILALDSQKPPIINEISIVRNKLNQSMLLKLQTDIPSTEIHTIFYKMCTTTCTQEQSALRSTFQLNPQTTYFYLPKQDQSFTSIQITAENRVGVRSLPHIISINKGDE